MTKKTNAIMYYRPIRADELLISWLIDMAIGNGLGCTKRPVTLFLERFLQSEDTNHHRPHADCVGDLYRVVQKIREQFPDFPDSLEILSMHTPYRLMGISRSEGASAYIAGAYLSTPNHDTGDLVKEVSDLTELKYCKKCGSYYRVWHQTPGVSVCAVHGTPLMRIPAPLYFKKEFTAIELAEGACEMPVTDFDRAFKHASFIKALYDSGCLYTSEDIDATFSEIKKRAYGFTETINVITDKPERENKLLGKKPVRKMYPVPDTFIVHKEWAGVVEAECRRCGKRIANHTFNFSLGFGCPVCDRKDPEELARKQLLEKGFTFDGAFKGYNSKMLMKHTCGAEALSTPFDRIWEDARCFCDRQVEEDEYAKRLSEKFPDFELVSFLTEGLGAQRMVTIRHKKCGREFRLKLAEFFRDCRCRCCGMGKPFGDSFGKIEKIVADLTPDYKVVAYTDMQHPMKIYHKACGFITEVLPQSFVRGTRCKLCCAHVEKDYIIDCIEKYAPGCMVVEADPKKRLKVRLADGRMIVEQPTFFMQELTRPTPSEVFPGRITSLAEPMSIRGQVYLRIKRDTERQGFWKYSQDMDDIADMNGVYNAIKKLLNLGIIERLPVGYRSLPNEDLVSVD